MLRQIESVVYSIVSKDKGLSIMQLDEVLRETYCVQCYGPRFRFAEVHSPSHPSRTRVRCAASPCTPFRRSDQT